jgi:L-fucose isomerase-like protein
MINKSINVELNVRPIYIGLIHQYTYEGPCRFGKGEELEKDYDIMMNQELYKSFKVDVERNMPDGVNMMEPIYVERADDFLSKEDMFEKMATDIEKVDLFLFSFGIGRGDIYVEFAQRYKKPQAVMPNQCCEAAVNTSAVRNRGYEAYAYRNWDDLKTHMSVLRARKALKSTRVLIASRFNSTRSFSSSDNFINLDEVTAKFGVQFRNINAHELIDQTKMIDPSMNPTLPGRTMFNINEEDMKEIDKITEELISGAKDNSMNKEMITNSVKAYYTVKKLLNVYDCNAFTIPCPDVCSTRRLNEEKYTFCLTHSLLNEQGIPSACELDLNALLSMTALTNLTGKASYMGNTNAVVYRDGKMVQLQGFTDDDIKNIDERDDLYLIFHSTPNRKLKGLNEPMASYGIAPFAYSGFGATIRYDFSQDAGQVVTLCRFAPDTKRLFIGKGTIVAGSGYDRNNCDEGFFFKVENQEDFFYKQINFGNHMGVVYGDCTKELKMLGESLNLEITMA